MLSVEELRAVRDGAADAVPALVAALRDPALSAQHEPSVACVRLLAALYADSDVSKREAMRAATVATHQRHATSEAMARAACKVYAAAVVDGVAAVADAVAEFENLVGALLQTWDTLWSAMAASTAAAVLDVFVRLVREGRITGALLERAGQLRDVLARLHASQAVAELTSQLCCELAQSRDAAHVRCLVDAGFVPTLLDVMDRYPDDAAMHHRALFVIANVLEGSPSRSALVHAHIVGNGGMGTLSASAGAHARHAGVLRCLGCILHHAASQGDAVVADLVRAGGAHIIAKLLAVPELAHPREYEALCTAVNVATALVPHMPSPLLAETGMPARLESAVRALEPALQLVSSGAGRDLVSRTCARASAAALQTLQD
jgi:hypothetical protein